MYWLYFISGTVFSVTADRHFPCCELNAYLMRSSRYQLYQDEGSIGNVGVRKELVFKLCLLDTLTLALNNICLVFRSVVIEKIHEGVAVLFWTRMDLCYVFLLKYTACYLACQLCRGLCVFCVDDSTADLFIKPVNCIKCRIALLLY